MSDENDTRSYVFNDERGTSCKFGSRPLASLLRKAKFNSLVRAHEVQDDGFKFHWIGNDGYPKCITVFSAPNYCGQYGNRGAVVCSTPTNIEILTYEEQ